MCLQIGKEDKNIKTAKTNIPVWKKIHKTGNGWLYNLEINRKYEPWIPGFHYTEHEFEEKALINGYKVEGNAFHSCKSYDEAKYLSSSVGDIIVEMYIPKGAKYYEDSYKYASSDIVYLPHSSLK